MSIYDQVGLSGQEAHEHSGQLGGDVRNRKVGSNPPVVWVSQNKLQRNRRLKCKKETVKAF